MEDLLGASQFHNINTYIISDKYTAASPEAQYDLNHPNAVVKEGDRFGYDYNLFINKGKLDIVHRELRTAQLYRGCPTRLHIYAARRQDAQRSGC